MSDRAALDSITRIISIDNVKDGEVYAYANQEQLQRFAELGISYTVLPHPGSLLTDQRTRTMGDWREKRG
ncbi:MAG: hypothetical protein MZV63_55815 [Marinilabiliales bacterium]|nr:hypothetical protein [Marinilabiliales bacterium]